KPAPSVPTPTKTTTEPVVETPVSTAATPKSVKEEVPVVAKPVEPEAIAVEKLRIDEAAEEGIMEEGGDETLSVLDDFPQTMESITESKNSSEEGIEFEDVYVESPSFQEPQERDVPLEPEIVETEEVVMYNTIGSFNKISENVEEEENELEEEEYEGKEMSHPRPYFPPAEPQNRISSTDEKSSMNAGVSTTPPPLSAVELSQYYHGVLRALYEEESFASALAWIKLGVAHGHGRLHWLLGVLYANGIGVPQSDAKAILHHTFAALEHVPEAHMALGRRYADGIGVASSCEKALRHYREVADIVAHSYNGVPNPLQHLREMRGGRLVDESEAMQLLMYRADEGATDALLALGRIYFRGRRGIPRDWHRARLYFLNALDRGEVAAYGALGQLHATGDNTAQPAIARDLATAATYYSQGAAQNDPVSLNGMGYLHAVGFYVNGQPATPEGETGTEGAVDIESSDHEKGKAKPDYVTAAEYFRLSAEHGSVEGIYNLGVLLLHGRGVPQDVVSAIRHFETAAVRGNLLSFWQLARIEYDKGNCMRSLSYYSRVASFNSFFDSSNDSPYFPLDEKGISPPIVPRKGNTLVQLFEVLSLAEAGHISSRKNAAQLIESVPIMEEPPEALENEVFAKSGRPPERAMKNESGVIWLEWYHTPTSNTLTEEQTPSSPRLLSQSEALNMLRLRIYGMSAIFGNPEANLRLGDFYYYGESRLIGSSMSQALMHYEAAASKHNPKALFNMGFMYQLGLGVKNSRNVLGVRDALIRIITAGAVEDDMNDDNTNNNNNNNKETEAKEKGKAAKIIAAEEMRLYLAKRYYDRVVEADPTGSVYAVNFALMSLNFQWWWLYFSRQRYGFSKLLGLPMPFEQEDIMEDITDTSVLLSSDKQEGENRPHPYRHDQQQQQQQQKLSVESSSSTSTSSSVVHKTAAVGDHWSWDDYILICSSLSLFVLLLLRHHGA
ncbi:uncharacterized protein TM35_000271540, partial [Trypanosoma theileri]